MGGAKEEPTVAEGSPLTPESEEERREKIREEMGQLYEELAEAAAIVNLRPLGTDRHHRRYWLFSSLPGLFVEEQSESPPNTAPEAGQTPEGHPKIQAAEKTSIPPSLLPFLMPTSQGTIETAVPYLGTAFMSSPVRNSLPTSHCVIDLAGSAPATNTVSSAMAAALTAPPADCLPDCPPPPSPSPRPPRWSCYSTPDDVESLIASLNQLGLRELQLQKSLENYKSIILAGIDKCPFAKRVKPSDAPSTSAERYLELYLREQILDIEEKIYIGNLGYLKDVENRAEWRKAIENSGAAATLATKEDKGATSAVASDDSESSAKQLAGATELGDTVGAPPCEAGREPAGQETPTVNPSVQELSTALLQVHAGISKKFLMPPLGMAVDTKKTRGVKKEASVIRESDMCPDQWRSSLAATTSFSQIFVHLATLERAVMWSRSLMLMRCRICRRKGGDEFMLLCDGCDHGYHMYCLRPPLQSVPDGDWFCQDCVPATPVKPR